MNPSILERIKSLPPLPKTLIDMQVICDTPDGTIADLALIAEKDPMIVANLLKSSNSPLYGVGKEITTVSKAVAMFGMSMTRSIALSTSVRTLLNVDMDPYSVTPDEFADISSMQAALINNWYKKVDPQKKEKLFLAALMQETGKIVIADEILQGDEAELFKSEIASTHDIQSIEKSFIDVTTANVTAAIFKHWGFDDELVDMIEYSDDYSQAPEAVKEYAMALNIVKTAIPINAALEEISITMALKKARDAGFDHELLEDEIDAILAKR